MLSAALIDDYQQVALEDDKWSALESDCAVDVFHDHLTDEDALPID